MEILQVEHTDFILIVECNDLQSTFNKAKAKQSGIFSSTSYSVSGGTISLVDFDDSILKPVLNEKTHPVFFENKDYFISVSFKEIPIIKNSMILSRIKEIEEKFFYRSEKGFLAGTVNFRNDLGKSDLILRYEKENKAVEIKLTFEVFPTKLDYRSDYDKIVTDIESAYPHLVLDFLKKTYSSFRTGNSSRTDLIWWQVFGGLYSDFITASKFILNKPHSRIIRQTRYIQAQNIISWTHQLEEEFAKFKHLPNKNYRSDYKRLSTDTPENKFFKHAVLQTLIRYKRVKKFIDKKFGLVITDNFKEELRSIEKQFEVISNNPFFKTVGKFQGIRQESLVLQKATGYSTIYKSWIMLNSGLKFMEGVQKIELKNIAELYQIWCFLKIKSVLQKLLKKENPDEIELAEIQVDDFIFKIERGVKSKVAFKQANGEMIELYHDFTYNKNSKEDVKTYTVNQRPDIVLKITKSDLKENYVLTYLYDAKYRLASDVKEDAPDVPPEDAINQMHRYRDAIYYVNKDKPEKEVIGAYVLFPGTGQMDSIKKQDFFKSISDVNIGAFPLKPNDHQNRTLLEDHLKSILGLDTESTLDKVAPQKLSTYEPFNPDVLIGIIRRGEQSDYFNSEPGLYYTGKIRPSRLKNENAGYLKINSSIKYFAPYFSGKGVREYYEILDYRIIPRNEIFPKGHALHDALDTSDRLVLTLGEKFTINNDRFFTCHIITYRYTKLNLIRQPKGNKIELLKTNTPE